MPADEHFEARTWGNGRLSGTPTSGGGLTDLEVRIGQALAEVPTQAELDTALESVATKAQQRIALAANPDALVVGAVTRNANGAATAANVVWPDGSTGAYAATTLSTAFPGAVDAYTVTYVPVSGPTLTYTQPAVTRNSTGAVTARPAITVA